MYACIKRRIKSHVFTKKNPINIEFFSHSRPKTSKSQEVASFTNDFGEQKKVKTRNGMEWCGTTAARAFSQATLTVVLEN